MDTTSCAEFIQLLVLSNMLFLYPLLFVSKKKTKNNSIFKSEVFC